MILNEITIENFYSVENQVIQLDKYSGLILVEGDNRDAGGSNGAGKSIIFEAIIWALFGKTIRKSTEDAMVNIKNGKNCRVTLRLNGTTIVRRSRKPTKLELIQDGNPVTQANAAITQTTLEAILNLNYKVFMASIVFGQHSDMDFLGATPEDKRIIIKNFLNLDEIFKYREVIKLKKSEFSNNVKAIEGAIIELDKLLVKNNSKLDKYKNLSIPKIVSEYTLERVIDENTRYKNDVIKYEKLVEEYKYWADKEKSYADRLADTTEVCSECGTEREIDQSMVKDQYKSCVGHAKKYKLALESFVPPTKPPISLQEFSKYSEDIKLSQEREYILESSKEIHENKENLFTNKKYEERNYDIMRFWEKAFSEQGIIKYIIRTILEKLNKNCNKYLTHLSNGQFTIVFDDELNETIKINNLPTHYISLSGGEKKKLNFSVMLALRDLLCLSGKDVSSVLLLDEIVENLDEQSLHGVYIILSELTKNKTVFLVTHNSYFKSLLESSKVLHAVKEKGKTEFKYAEINRV